MDLDNIISVNPANKTDTFEYKGFKVRLRQNDCDSMAFIEEHNLPNTRFGRIQMIVNISENKGGGYVHVFYLAKNFIKNYPNFPILEYILDLTIEKRKKVLK